MAKYKVTLTDDERDSWRRYDGTPLIQLSGLGSIGPPIPGEDYARGTSPYDAGRTRSQ